MAGSDGRELRTPLTSILGWCALLGDEAVRLTLLDEGPASIDQAARVQSALVEDLLDVSRIAAGRLKLTVATIDAAKVVEQAIASVAPSARRASPAMRRSRCAPACRCSWPCSTSTSSRR